MMPRVGFRQRAVFTVGEMLKIAIFWGVIKKPLNVLKPGAILIS